MLPVARAADVSLQLHPNDPPVNHQGVARIFRSTDSFRQSIDIAGGDTHAGTLFCVGTWSEMTGPGGKGEDIPAAIREFGSSGHIHQVHFRNTSAPLPRFHETFPDNGYVDLVSVMRALVDIGFGGIVVPDHVPGDGRIEEAYTFGYIRFAARKLRVAGARPNIVICLLLVTCAENAMNYTIRHFCRTAPPDETIEGPRLRPSDTKAGHANAPRVGGRRRRYRGNRSARKAA